MSMGGRPVPLSLQLRPPSLTPPPPPAQPTHLYPSMLYLPTSSCSSACSWRCDDGRLAVLSVARARTAGVVRAGRPAAGGYFLLLRRRTRTHGAAALVGSACPMAAGCGIDVSLVGCAVRCRARVLRVCLRPVCILCVRVPPPVCRMPGAVCVCVRVCECCALWPAPCCSRGERGGAVAGEVTGHSVVVLRLRCS